MLKIGVTERGDAGIDLSWTKACREKRVDGCIAITKNLNKKARNKILNLKDFPIIVHCTCTGWGQSYMEPNVPDYKTQLANLQSLIESGFPAERCVIRIDPIIPTDEGLHRAKLVIDTVTKNQIFDACRIRFSIFDEYKHVRARFLANNIADIYDGGRMFCNITERQRVTRLLAEYKPRQFESCAELYIGDNILRTGCVSPRDLYLMGFSRETIEQNSQANACRQRKLCECLPCKTELLKNRCRCPHKCMYCFWYDT